ncbi:hypothetical protein HOC54_05860, partial [Candidatus Peregrinibacteria bacterium]|nr:hypothetical protein [Candidatus Peregrinibacteria bacterium]
MSLLGPMLPQQEFIDGYWRNYQTGGPKVSMGPDHQDILVTWMNDEIMPGDYDIYYSKSLQTYPTYVFDADWSTPCPYVGGYVFGDPNCEDAK